MAVSWGRDVAVADTQRPGILPGRCYVLTSLSPLRGFARSQCPPLRRRAPATQAR